MCWKTTLINKAQTSKKFFHFLLQRAKNDTIFRVSSSLSYTSLIAIVPLFAIGLAIFSAFPGFNAIKDQFQEFILKNFVPDIGQEISQYFVGFLNASAQMTTIGVVGLAVTSIMLLSTIENSLNFIFKVYKPRNIKTKITLYWTVITLGPILLGAAFSLRSYLFALQKIMPEQISQSMFIGNMIPSIMTMLVLVMVYTLVPNKKVPLLNAFVGALVAVFLFWVLRKVFGILVIENATYKTLYGALATLPVFLIWMYLSWSVVIFGAVVTASLDDFQEENQEKQREFKIVEYKENFPQRKNKKRTKKFLPKEQK